MANFEARTASNDPGLTDAAAVRTVLGRWYPCGEDLTVEVGGADDDHAVIEFYGYSWPEMARRPEGATVDWNPWEEDGIVDDDLQGFMLEVAPFLKDEWVVQAIGGEKCRYPLAACEIVVAPGATEATVRQLSS